MPDNDKPVGKLKPINITDTNPGYTAPVGKLKPIGITDVSPINSFRQSDVIEENDDQNIESALSFIKEKGGRNNSTLLDSDIDTIRGVLKDPRSTQEQKKNAILTVQGYGDKHDDDNQMYYTKLDSNGVYVPVALGKGERSPKAYEIASVWGTQKDANDDSWYTDLGKSLANGVIGAVGGIADTANTLGTLITGEESDLLTKTKNTLDAFKFKKDEDLNTPVFNTEGVTKFSDLLDKDRFDLSPKALWGTLNMAAESFTEFGLGAYGAGTVAKGGKALRYGLQGIEDAVTLSKLGQKASIFTGSFMAQLGDNLDNAEKAGLTGRDKAAVASAITAPMAALDTFYGLDGKIMSSLFNKGKRELLQNAVRTVERDASGNITEAGFRELTRDVTLGYSQLAKTGIKEVAKDAVKEGTQEAAQEFSKRAGEQLWDKLSPEDKGKFGTDAFSAKSFGEYVNNFAMGLVSGVPMAVSSANLKANNEFQSQSAYARVVEGPQAVNALKVDLTNALDKGEINQQEHDEALFKLNKYQQYHELTKKYNLKPEDEKRAFELSFQIDGLETEIPTNTQEIHSMSPIERADLKSKEKMQKDLQDELNKIILRSDVRAEPTVAVKTEQEVNKLNEEAIPDLPEMQDEVIQEQQPSEKPVTTRRKLLETPPEEFNTLSSLARKQTVQEHLKSEPNNAIQGFIEEGQNGKLHVNIGDGRYLTFAQSVKPTGEGKTENIRRENLPPTMEKGKVKTLNGEVGVNPDTLEPLASFKEPVNVQRQEIDAYDKEGKQIFNEDGTPKKKAVLNVFNGETGKYIISIRENDKLGRTYKASQYSAKEIEQLKDLQEKGFNDGSVTVNQAPISKSKEAEDLLNKGIENNRVRREELIKEGKTPDEASEITYNEFLETPEGKRYSELTKESKPEPKPESKPVEEKGKKQNDKKPGKPIKTINDVSIGDNIIDINGKKGIVTDIKEDKLYMKMETGASYSANPKFVELFSEDKGQLQKEATSEDKNIQKVVDAIQKALPNIDINLTDKGEFAGKLSQDGKTITINTNYAALDTPIHEAGHVLIDAIGYNNKVIQVAIKQLKNTDLYKATALRYPELNEEQLNKEVLAEAIGREGAGIFSETTDKNKFKQALDYIYDWLKRKLGLDKNVAKSLARQIISGIGTKNITGTENQSEQLQKNKKPKPKTLSYSQYRASKLRNIEQEDKDLASSESIINDPNSKPEEVAKAKISRDSIKKIRKEDSADYKEYKANMAVIQQIVDSEDLSTYSNDKLIDLYNQIKNFEEKSSEALRKDVMLRIANNLHKKGKERIMAEHSDYIESLANTKDIAKGQIWLMNGSHFTEYSPDMQEAYKSIQAAQLEKLKEANQRKFTNEKLAKAVIQEENKRLGLKSKGSNLFNSDSAKYFEYMDNGNGQLLTIDEAKAAGLSQAKLDYLDFTRKLLSERQDLMTQNNYENSDLDVVRVDKKFSESFRQDGLAQAFSYYLGGGGSNLGNIRIPYKGTITEFKNIEKDIISNVKKGDILSNIKALFELLRYNVAARRQLKRGFNVDEKQNPLELKGDSQYSINQNGVLTSKFDKPRDKNRGYSKDFYRAMIEYIDDTSHVKHINPILSIIDSVELLNKEGYAQEGIGIKPNVAKWIEEFKKLHIFKEPHVNDPILDGTLKFFRQLTSATTMWFNLPAQTINVVMGNYNNWRQENAQVIKKGNSRFFSKKGVNRYALDIIQKYSIVNQDFDSNPKIGLGKIFDKISRIGTTLGEYQIQGSLALGLMSDEDYNSFEYVTDKYGIKQLVVKPGVDEKALNERMIGYKNRVTDIQGKYPDEDRRNIMRGEIGKAVFQFKVWIPDWFKERFGGRYINSRNEIKEGTFNQLMREGFKQIKSDIDQKGLTKALWENKAFMSNLKGLVAIGALLVYKYQDDDDEKKRKKASIAQNALSQLMFIADLDQLKYTVSNPVAALGKTKDVINAVQSLVKLDKNKAGDYTFDDKIKRVLPANKLINIADQISEASE